MPSVAKVVSSPDILELDTVFNMGALNCRINLIHCNLHLIYAKQKILVSYDFIGSQLYIPPKIGN